MRLYRVENINKVFDKPIKVYAETAREAIKKAFGIENVRQDKYGNIVVCGVCSIGEKYARVMRWVYKEVDDEQMQRLWCGDSVDKNDRWKSNAVRPEQSHNRYGERRNGNRIYSALGDVPSGKIV